MINVLAWTIMIVIYFVYTVLLLLPWKILINYVINSEELNTKDCYVLLVATLSIFILYNIEEIFIYFIRLL